MKEIFKSETGEKMFFGVIIQIFAVDKFARFVKLSKHQVILGVVKQTSNKLFGDSRSR